MSADTELPLSLHPCPECEVEVTAVTAAIDPRRIGYLHRAQCGHIVAQVTAMRWWADGMRWTVPHIDGASLVAAERLRQVTEEGYTPAHDAEHDASDLPWAAYAYLTQAVNPSPPGRVPSAWPWAAEEWKPEHSPLRMLTIAGALIAAEIDRQLVAARRLDSSRP